MKQSFQVKIKKIGGIFTPAYITKVALLTGISYILYLFCKFPLPFMFPAFLDMQFSELPAILAGFSMGPLAGCLVVIIKCLLKLPLSSTLFVGEMVDILLGISYVLPASIIYKCNKTKKGALISLACGTVFATLIGMLANRFIAIPAYVNALGWNFSGIVALCSNLYPGIAEDNFYLWYIFVAILPFNLLRLSIVSVITFFAYKRLSKILHWEIKKGSKPDKNGDYISSSEEDTVTIAQKLSKRLTGGETILLNGELGAGKTTFTKALFKALGVTGIVTSPTFTVMKTYQGTIFTLHHLDMYRMASEDDVEELGLLEDLGEKDITVIEWNKFTAFNGKVITINISYLSDSQRKIHIEGINL